MKVSGFLNIVVCHTVSADLNVQTYDILYIIDLLLNDFIYVWSYKFLNINVSNTVIIWYCNHYTHCKLSYFKLHISYTNFWQD